ncbi:MAG: winged helix-turn-helix domain-containing protein [Acidobacteria bacterium]|nr:winged helix-turn-helix domain-containing protein [Acidobacteriota bacterium]
MQAEKTSRQIAHFGIFDLDVQARSLHKSGIRIKLQGQPFDLLVCLISKRGEVVTRDELQRNLWPADTFVDFEHSVNTAVKRLRDALGDSAENPRFIETVPRCGYRFIAPVEWHAKITSPPPADLPKTMREPERRASLLNFRTAGLIMALLALVVVLLGFRNLRNRLLARSTVPSIQSLVVLPFVNLTGDVEQDYFADGMTEALTTELGKTNVVRVISRTSAMQYKQTRKSVPNIGRELNVEGVVEGSVQRASDRVSVTAQLIYAPTDRHLWAQSYERDLRNAPAMQREVAQAIAYAVQSKFTPRARPGGAAFPPVDPDAYREYLRGRFFWEQRSEQALERSISYFDHALAIDPNFALAYAAEAEAYIPLAVRGFRPPREPFRKAKEMATKALELDDTLPGAHNALAAVRFNEYDWGGAEEEFKRAIELNPSYVPAHLWHGYFLEALGQQSANLAERKLAQELDPLNVTAGTSVGTAYFYLGQYDQAIEEQRRTLELAPGFSMALVNLGQVYEAKAMYADAIASYKKAGALASLGHAYAASGNKAEARELLQELDQQSKHHYVSPYDRALIYAGLGESEPTISWLEKAEEENVPLHHINVDQRFNFLRSDRRYQQLLQRMGFPP